MTDPFVPPDLLDLTTPGREAAFHAEALRRADAAERRAIEAKAAADRKAFEDRVRQEADRRISAMGKEAT